MINGLKRSLAARAVVFCGLGLSSTLWAWGETGHNVIGRVAARLTTDASDKPLRDFILFKEEMMGHLCNIPDISWRSAKEKIVNSNAPTHYLDVEFLLADGKTFDFAAFPRTIQDARKVIETHCAQQGSELCPPGKTFAQKMDRVGTAPWRINQLMTMALSDMKKLQEEVAKTKPGEGDKKKSGSDKRTKLADSVATYWGVVGHYVGDLANPLHTTVDYDAWKRNQGGLHAYFETDIVRIAPLSLGQEVYDYARAKKPWETSILPILQKNKADPADAYANAVALLENSWVENREALFALDEKVSLTGKSLSKGGLKVPAQRKAPKEVYSQYRDFMIARLALAADTLSHLWLLSWEKAGKPDLAAYNSYNYPVDPEFIWPDYLK
jgi:hypothetical protein